MYKVILKYGELKYVQISGLLAFYNHYIKQC